MFHSIYSPPFGLYCTLPTWLRTVPALFSIDIVGQDHLAFGDFLTPPFLFFKIVPALKKIFGNNCTYNLTLPCITGIVCVHIGYPYDYGI